MTDGPLPGDFGLCSIAGDVGTMIRVGQWLLGDGFSQMEHAFVYVGSGRIVEAEPGGARLGAVAEYAGRPILWSSGKIPLTIAQRTGIVTAARAMIGTPYSFLDYAALVAHRFHLPGGRLLRDYIASTKHQICSQAVDSAYNAAGVHLFQDGRWPGYVTPGNLYELLTR